jgi:hypothetical protein
MATASLSCPHPREAASISCGAGRGRKARGGSGELSGRSASARRRRRASAGFRRTLVARGGRDRRDADGAMALGRRAWFGRRACRPGDVGLPGTGSSLDRVLHGVSAHVSALHRPRRKAVRGRFASGRHRRPTNRRKSAAPKINMVNERLSGPTSPRCGPGSISFRLLAMSAPGRKGEINQSFSRCGANLQQIYGLIMVKTLRTWN